MKKVSILLALILCCGIVQAQQTNLKICGIAMSQSISTFKSQLGQKGFSLMQGRTDDKGYSGPFAGYKCSLFINPYEGTKQDFVHTIEIGLSADNGLATHERFRELELMYMAKYGKYERNVWYDSRNSSYEKEELTWTFPYGYIRISYERNGFDGSLTVMYRDNTSAKKGVMKLYLQDL